ncbi:penicillin-binding protein [Acidithiobacillus ferrivorans]|uniref:penicillin-binding protein 2 n=1 Tax=Acidithiobacillus ferrivorans TaxID=160808 RepID=UPI000893EA0D|nr:penicillin-binding protein 2 [Acidithiobacillus ferrivorans]OFA15400.1 penicillin-binding protein [Acidithiobacillus ferrivorans]
MSPGEPKARRFRERLALAFVVLVAAFIFLIWRLVDLEVVHYQRFRQMARANHTAIVPVAPSRGLILARHGQILATNHPRYALELIPDEVVHLNQTLARVRELIHIPAKTLHHLLATRDDKPGYIPRILLHHIDPKDIATISVRKMQYPGVQVAAQMNRYYPFGSLFTSVIGYVGPVSARNLKRFDPQKYLYRNVIGESGLEYAFERVLRGKFGYQIKDINAFGVPVANLRNIAPMPGDNLLTTLRLRVQRAVARVMRSNHFRGALVAVDPRTGAILASVSNPSFNANWFVDGISNTHWNSLLHNPDHPLLNRVAQGLYPPGSTIKPFYSLEALQDKIITPGFHTFCPGYLRIGGHVYRDWYSPGFGETGLTKALSWSVDVFFYKLALKMGIHRQDAALWRFGFGHPAPIDTPGSAGGFVPTPQWKEAHFQQPWYTGDSIILGIGQGYLLVTPLQLVRAVSAIANGGYLVHLHVARALINSETGARAQLREPPPRNLHIPAFALRAVQRGMIACVTRGTCKTMATPGLPMAGKTGTAEVPIGYRDGRTIYNDDSLFIGWAPLRHPQIAVAAVVEDGGNNAWQALPVAKAAILSDLRPHMKRRNFTNIVVNPSRALG